MIVQKSYATQTLCSFVSFEVNSALLLLQQHSYTWLRTSSGELRRVVFSSILNRAHRDPKRAIALRATLRNGISSAAESLFAVLFPSNCRICQQPLTNVSTLPVCEACLIKIAPLEGILCTVCGEKLFSEHTQTPSGALCGMCRRAAPHFRKAISYGAYDGSLRELIHLFKYNSIKPAGRLLGQFLDTALASATLSDSLLLIPVPLWRNKRQSRGFNQAEAVARAFMGLRPSGSIQLDTASLVRTRETASQTGLTRHQRRANVRGAFAVSRPEKVRGRSILLVDDVMTTGTTVNECSRVLLRVGAKEVFVATVARATKEVGSGLINRDVSSLSRGTSA
jgi:ComF family protein